LGTLLKDTAKGEFVLPLDSYTKLHYEKKGTTKLFSKTAHGIEIPLVRPINLEDQRLNRDRQDSFLDSLYAARQSSAKQLEWALRYGSYTKEKTLTQILKNFLTFRSITNRENEILDSMALSYLGWAVLHETSDTLSRVPELSKFSEFYSQVSEISKPMTKKMYADYSQICSMKGFANPIYSGDLDMYKVSIISALREVKTAVR